MEFKFSLPHEGNKKNQNKITVKKKRELFLGFSLIISRFCYVTIFYKKYPRIGKGILTFFPFDN